MKTNLMRRLQVFSLGLMTIGGVVVGGCASSPPPATQPMAMGPAAPMVKPPEAKDLTHVLTQDEPYFASEPTASSPPSGTLKAGSKVLVLIPGAQYSQVITDMGVSAYTVTDGLKPLGK